MPEPEPTVATDVTVLLHAPPLVALLKEVVDPTQTDAVPVIGDGNGLTVTVVKPGDEEGHPLKYAVTEYTPDPVSGIPVIDGFCNPEENSPGPDQL